MLLETGTRIDRYELLCPIATGGMGAVWAARLRGKHGFQRLLAIKVLRLELAADGIFRSMFLDEMRIVTAIDHPNVVAVVDLGEEAGMLFAAIDYVDGPSLNDLIRAVECKGEIIPSGIVARILADACAGLHAAHELTDAAGRMLDVVHRDISPQNLLIGRNGRVRVIDFGIAKARARLAENTTGTSLKGKVRYMPLEQLGRGAVDRRSDVWALGAVLYRALSGHSAYRGENEIEVLRAVLDDEPIEPLPATVPRAFSDVVMRMLAREPDQRPPSAERARFEIERAMTEARITTTADHVAAYLADQMSPFFARRSAAIDAAMTQLDGKSSMPRLLLSPSTELDLSELKLDSTVSRTVRGVGPPTAPEFLPVLGNASNTPMTASLSGSSPAVISEPDSGDIAGVLAPRRLSTRALVALASAAVTVTLVGVAVVKTVDGAPAARDAAVGATPHVARAAPAPDPPAARSSSFEGKGTSSAETEQARSEASGSLPERSRLDAGATPPNALAASVDSGRARAAAKPALNERRADHGAARGNDELLGVTNDRK